MTRGQSYFKEVFSEVHCHFESCEFLFNPYLAIQLILVGLGTTPQFGMNIIQFTRSAKHTSNTALDCSVLVLGQRAGVDALGSLWL